MILKYHHLLLSLLCMAVSVTSINKNLTYIKILLGGIKGYYKISAKGRQYEAYESIRYAQPPIGKLRFEPPVPVIPWSEDIEALSLPPACMQYETLHFSTLGVEDCLYLNIYTPAKNKSDSMPVIFWIHGGGFQYGTSSNYGPKFLMDRDVILVTINYRVGPLGFLSTGDEVVPGNMGLKDQSLALKWTSENIASFGGDSKRITLMGVSAGGASVQYHYLTPLSHGLFQNGISFSGSALCHWAFASDSRQTTKKLAEILKCPTNNALIMVQCLKNISSYDIIAAIYKIIPFPYFSQVVFPPVAENINANYFINDTPTNIIVNGNAYDVPWITGIVKDEGIFMIAGFALNKTLMEYTDKNWKNVGPYLLVLKDKIDDSKLSKIAIKSREHYFGNESFTIDMKSIGKLTHLIGDEVIAYGAIRAAKLQARYNKSPVSFYYYTYRAAQSFSDYLSNSTIDFGVCHDDDIYIVLDGNFIDQTTIVEDRAMQQDMLNFWVSYATTGKADLGTAWSRLKEPSDKLHYMHIAGPQDFTMEASNNLAEETFWKQIV